MTPHGIPCLFKELGRFRAYVVVVFSEDTFVFGHVVAVLLSVVRKAEDTILRHDRPCPALVHRFDLLPLRHTL